MVACRVCNRPLRNLISIAQGVGPVCMKKVRRALHEMLEQVRRGEAPPNYENAYAMSPDELQRLVSMDVREAYLNQLRQNRRPTSEPIEVEMPSRTRNTQETVTVRWIDRDHAYVESQNNQTYETTTHSCSCPDFIHHRSRNPQLAEEGCRHMQALRLASDVVSRQRSERAQRRFRSGPVDPVQVQEANRLTFAQIDWTEEHEREQVLDTWREARAFDGVFMSRDQEVWDQLKQKAEEEWEYQYENVLGGTGNTFGIEVEVEFDGNSNRRAALQALQEAGLLETAQMRGYHSGDSRGFWKAERDGSLGEYGMELVSPILRDDRQTWDNIKKATEILKLHGAKVSQKTGGHIHLGIAPLDHRTYSWQRLARIGVAFERQFFRMGGANSDSYRRWRVPGRHRGTHYSEPLNSYLSFGGNISAQSARSQISDNRYKMFNATNIDSTSGGRPALEMRYPNGTLDYRQIQAQIQVANAVVHQAAVIRNDSPNSVCTPRFSETSRHLRLEANRVTEQEEESNFREFLDVLGNPEDRLAAIWLWNRGRAN